jgi:hypothetical protein
VTSPCIATCDFNANSLSSLCISLFECTISNPWELEVNGVQTFPNLPLTAFSCSDTSLTFSSLVTSSFCTFKNNQLFYLHLNIHPENFCHHTQMLPVLTMMQFWLITWCYLHLISLSKKLGCWFLWLLLSCSVLPPSITANMSHFMCPSKNSSVYLSLNQH